MPTKMGSPRGGEKGLAAILGACLCFTRAWWSNHKLSTEQQDGEASDCTLQISVLPSRMDAGVELEKSCSHWVFPFFLLGSL